MENELFWKLLKPFHPMAASFCQRLTGDSEEGKDLYQDALLSALRRFDSLKDHAAFRPWLFRIIINSFKNRSRSLWRRRRVPWSQDHTAQHDPRADMDNRRWLKAALRELSEEDRVLIVLHEIEGWSLVDLAALLKRPEGTIKTRLFRARAKMRKWLERNVPAGNITRKTGEVVYAMQRCKSLDK